MRKESELARTREALARQQAQVGALEDGPAMLWITDPENMCTFLSRAWYEYTGQSSMEGMRLGWLDAVHPADRPATAAEFEAATRERRPFSLDHRLRRHDGEYRWVLDEGRPHFSPDGEYLGYAGAVIDVHDRRTAAEALRESEARYRSLFESLDEGFCVIEVIFDDDTPVDYRFIEANPAFVLQTGLQDAIGRTARELLPDLEDHWFEIYGDVARTGASLRFERGSDAMGRWFSVYAFRIGAPEMRRVALLFTDVSDQRNAAAERERLLKEAQDARAEAEAANRAKAEFLAAMSHELRTPLNAIGGYVDLLDLEVHGPLADQQRSALSRITANQRHLLRLINDILSFAKLEAGGITFDLQPIEALDLLRSVESLVAPQAAAQGIEYRVVPCSPELRLIGDAERVRQILLNLISNAVKFTGRGGHVALSCVDDGEWVRIDVRDDGIGIAADQQERIFDAFQQVGRRLDRPADGVGLGLAISRDLARAMDGDLTVRSAPGEGSTFTLRLRRTDAQH